jgi:catechol 2,3-dioxygenase-like lactoylglutathione lyase family enzyme
VIEALDHFVLRASFVSGAVGAYETLLGRKADTGVLRVGNVGLRIEDSAATARLTSIAFATPDLDKAAHLLERRAVPTSRSGAHLALAPTATHGVPIDLVERNQAPAPSPFLKSSEAAAIAALDHVVIRTPNPERAIAFYAGRLGLDLRLDRSNPDWGSRLLFFRCGDLVVEIAHALKGGASDAPDELWGLSWRAADIVACNERLKTAGVEVSPPRTGRRPGTQIFSVQSHTANVPTIVIGGIGRW